MNRFKLLVLGMAFLGSTHAAAPNPASFELAVVDMQGQKKVLGTLPGSVFAPRVSPEGRRVAFEMADPPAPNTPEFRRLYVADIQDIEKRKALQPTVTSLQHVAPVWSPDGDWIAFVAMGNGDDALFRTRADGWIQPKYLIDGRAAEGLYRGGQNDGGVMVFITRKGDRDYGISQFDIHSRKATVLIDLPNSEQHSSRISPDGRWLAYTSDETGRREVWAEPLPQTGKRFQLTREGGNRPQWSPDGRTLYFDQGGRIFRASLTATADSLQAAAPTALPITGFQQGEYRRQYDLLPDGSGFLMLFPVRAPQ